MNPTALSVALGRSAAKRLASTGALLVAFLAFGCAGGGGGHHGGGGGGGGGGGPTGVMITTRPGSIAAGTTVTFAAQVNNDTGQGVNWSLSPSSGAGTLSNPQNGPFPYSINYNAPTTTPNPNSVTLKATSVAAPALSDSVTFTITGGAAAVTTIATSVPFPIFAGDPATSIAITVANDAAGDVLSAQLTVDSNTGSACTPASCGSLGPVTGSAGSGSYTVSYTPPAAAGFITQTMPTLLVSSTIGSFPATDYIEVDPAGVPLVTIDGLGIVGIGSAPRVLTATVYNDPNHAGAKFMPLNATGYACSSIGANTCGALSQPTAAVASGTTTTTTITYTPPAALPAPPYDKPRIQAISVADNTQFAFARPLLTNSNPGPGTGLRIPFGNKFNSALASPSAAAIPVTANIGNDTGSSLSVNWTLTAAGAPCAPTCGTLGNQSATYNGTSVSSTINYTPPPTLPSVPADLTPTITASSVDNPNATDHFTFTLSDGTCGTTNNANLNGQYAFLLPGGGANPGFGVFVGSFTANGIGGITGGLFDANTSTGPITGSITSAGSSYSVGSDNRACLTLVAAGLVLNFRAGMGSTVGGFLTQGRITHFDDNNSLRGRQGGVLMKQDATAFTTGLSGNYALGFQGVDSSGGRLAGAGALTASGGAISNLNLDVNDAGSLGPNLTGGSGSYTSVNSSGRGTATTTITAPGGQATTNFILYMVSSSEILFITSDSLLAGKPIQSGELRKQSVSFLPTSLDNAGYVLYLAGVDPTNGGNDAQLMQATVTTSGSSTLTIDENDNGTTLTERTLSPMLSIAMNGRVTASVAGVPVFYLVDSSSGFVVSTDKLASSGFLEKQVLVAPFTTASIKGNFFFGGAAPTPGSPYQSGTAGLDGLGNITGTTDSSGPGGLKVRAVSPATGGTYSFLAMAVPSGKGTVGANMPAYAISSSKLVFMITDKPPELIIAQQ